MVNLFNNPTEELKYSIKKMVFNIFNSSFIYNFIGILLKTIFFIMIISDDKASKLNTNIISNKNPSSIIYVTFIAFILSFGFLTKKSKWSFFIINLVITVIYIGDVLYYRSNSSFLNPHLLQLTTNLDNLGGSIFSLFRKVDILLILDLILFIPISFLIKGFNEKNKSIFAIISITSMLVLVNIYINHDVINHNSKDEKLFSISWAPNESMYVLTPIGYHMVDTVKYFKESKPLNLSPEEKNQIYSWLVGQEENLPDNKYKGSLKDKNLLIIQVESLENFVIGKEVDGQEITPNMNKLLKNSLYFNNFHEQTYKGTTSDAELITNTSLLPVRDGSTFFRFPNNSYPSSLPNLLKKRGYSTVAAHADKGSYWNWVNALSSIGYDKCFDITAFEKDEKIGMGLSDESFFKQLADIINKQGKPFLNFAVTLTNHGPFVLPDEYKTLHLEDELDKSILGKYFQTVRYTDKQIGMLLDELDKKGILDNTTVVIYGDHEGINKYYADEVEKLPEKYHFALENDLRVPLIIYSKNIKGEVFDTTAGQVDLLPTLAYLMDIDKSELEGATLGRNLLNTNKDFVITALGEYKGKSHSNEEVEDRIKSLEISDKIINSNFFKGY